MGRGVSSGGGQSSLGYLFGGNEAPAPRPAATTVEAPAPTRNSAPTRNAAPPATAVKPSAAAPSGGDAPKQIPAGIQGSQTNNNYFRADGQNTGNFLTVSFNWNARHLIAQIDHPPKSMLRQEADLRWDIFSEMASSIFAPFTNSKMKLSFAVFA
ncbi:hypothetical protein SASPL_149564 [Salvia splendens]|uniref:Protein SPIRAL1 n=1 Tax=Salvia splendens TaxID=180675 RepID=A0A8X8WCG2_SALSN|nr:hypothetical protein SASPL_149564 [Salvia splendens]